ncbi:hypothetical protein FD755_001226 [Muntiacus reevesi]|uniref:GB1/RHD3-type G domain-containing protein n=1 Tax=Muntiacus reevesi TaxID=9886 RepID=A0A5J5N6L1_MUNRE|nr:hypothetical protein FD755_001226 [Muntiacus reevesi]
MERVKDEQSAGSFPPAAQYLGLDLRHLQGNSLCTVSWMDDPPPASIQECRKDPTGDSKNDSWIFALAMLLSFIYNSMSTINHQALEQLHYVTELTELIRIKPSPISDDVEDSVEFVRFFPDFVWAVRDFMLELELNGNPITEDEYLENALKLIPGIRAGARW